MKSSKFTSMKLLDRIERKWLSLTVVGLVLANIVLAFSAFSTHSIVTVMPPNMKAVATVAADRANAPYYKSWGVFLAQTLGNVQPKRAKFVLSTIKPLLASDIYRKVVNAITQQVGSIKADQVSVSFTPNVVKYDPNRDLIFVTGDSVSEGPGSKPVKITRTYEFTLKLKDYRPIITHLSVYEGGPHKRGEKE